MATLSPKTHLQRISKIDLQIKPNNTIRLKWGRKHLTTGTHTLPILSAFSQSKSFADGLKQAVQIEGTDEAVLSNTIIQLYEAGVLRNVTAVKGDSESTTIAFNTPAIHIEMLNDKLRTSSYLKAIREVVRPGDVVVDLGTGTGVLAIAAAKAGAKHVYAIEVNNWIAQVAQANFERNGVADRITLCRGRSTNVTLPERADVLVSEIIGDDPFDEQIVAITTDARLRFLKPNARLIPSQIQVFGLPITVPAKTYAAYMFSAQAVAEWQASYGIDFSALTEVAHPEEDPVFNIPPQQTRTWRRLSDPILLANINLYHYHGQRISYSGASFAKANGILNGLLIYFEVALSAQTNLSTHPDEACVNTHWRSPVWGAFSPFEVQVGKPFSVQYDADLQNNWTYACVSKYQPAMMTQQAALVAT